MSTNKPLSPAEMQEKFARVIEKQTGLAVRPYRVNSQFRGDGYVNLLTKYGTSRDTTENYTFQREADVDDTTLIEFYEGNGLFAKIIDAPAEEAIKHGFSLKGLNDTVIEDFFTGALDELDFEETAMTAMKWSRLFGGSLVVMLINDGRGIDEPLDWSNIQSIDDLRVYDRSLIQPDTHGMFRYEPDDPFRTRGSRLGTPERYHIFSKYGSFTVHESRCLLFQNGILPENTTNQDYEFWGLPEYLRIKRAVRDAELSHGSATKMLDRSVQAVYKMKNLAALLATEQGEDQVLKRLQTIDLARGLMSSITIDAEGEDYDFRQFNFGGVSEVVDTTCNFLSALTSIPQTILFGRSPAGMNATGTSDMENYYNYVERIQKRMLRSNIRYLLSIIFQAGVYTGEVDEVPDIKIEFNPLWSMSDSEQADLEMKKAQTQQTKAQTAQIYVDMQAIDPSEVRKKLADSEEFDVENLLDEYDMSEDDLFEGMDNPETDDMAGGNSPEAAPAATKLPQDMNNGDLEQAEGHGDSSETDFENMYNNATGVGVVVVKDGKILCGTRLLDTACGTICGPGGHIEKGETPESAALRETVEEFGIKPKEIEFVGFGPLELNGNYPAIFLCTDFEGELKCRDGEMSNPDFLDPGTIEKLRPSCYQPFINGLDLLFDTINNLDRLDEEPAKWVTINGNPIPLNHEGRAIGGNPAALGEQSQAKRKTPKESNESLKKSFSVKDSKKLKDSVEEASRNMENGQSIVINDMRFTKTDDSTFLCSDGSEWDFSDVSGLTETLCDEGSLEKSPEVLDAPKEYKNNLVELSEQDYRDLQDELMRNKGSSVSNDDIDRYLESIDSFRNGAYVPVVAASADFGGVYEEVSKILSDSDKKEAKKHADDLEEFLSVADKYEGWVERGMGFDVGGRIDPDGSKFQKAIEQFKPGNVIDMGHTSSWTTAEPVIGSIISARTENDEDATKSYAVILKCPQSKNGVDIGRFCPEFSQSEIAYSKNQKFRVRSCDKFEKWWGNIDAYIVYLDEVNEENFDDKWVTINGTHVEVTKNGSVNKGPNPLKKESEKRVSETGNGSLSKPVSKAPKAEVQSKTFDIDKKSIDRIADEAHTVGDSMVEKQKSSGLEDEVKSKYPGTMTTEQFVEKCKEANASMSEQDRALNAAYTAAPKTYSGIDFNAQGANLRILEGIPLSDDEKEVLAHLSRCAKPLGFDADVYRSSNTAMFDKVAAGRDLSEIVGEEFTCDTVMSTAAGVHSYFSGKNCVTKISVPGDVAVCMTTAVAEGEVVIPPKARFRVKSVEQVDDKEMPVWRSKREHEGTDSESYTGYGLDISVKKENNTVVGADCLSGNKDYDLRARRNNERFSGTYIELELLGYDE